MQYFRNFLKCCLGQILNYLGLSINLENVIYVKLFLSLKTVCVGYLGYRLKTIMHLIFANGRSHKNIFDVFICIQSEEVRYELGT